MDSPYLIRSCREEDLEELYRLANLVYFINLPADREIIAEKIRLSLASFSGELEDKHEREYIFVMESLEDHSIIGTSMIIARHGSPKTPHMYFELKELQKYSETIHSGFIHKVLRLRFEHDGPTEIGGLVLNPNFRKHKAKLGRQLSYSRFLYIKMRRRWFKDRILSELMPPLSEQGESILWEAVGRRFTNLSYQEADALSRKNKEFVTSLFPKGDIFTCLLDGEVRDSIGRVGTETEPVKHMLEKIGFSWRQHIDPFDGGPHYMADTDKITLVKESRKGKLARDPLKRKVKEFGLIAIPAGNHFAAIQTPYEQNRTSISIPKAAIEALELSPGAPVYLLPIT